MSDVRVVITERRNFVSVEESEVSVNVEESRVVVNIGGGSEGDVTEDELQDALDALESETQDALTAGLATKGDAFAWVLDLTEGNTAPARAANDTEIADALAAVAAGDVQRIIAPPGDWYFNTTIDIVDQTWLQGAGEWYYGGTNFFFPNATTFMRILLNQGSSPNGGRGSLIERIRFGPAVGGVFNADVYGIYMEARATLRDVNVTSVHGHGVAVLATTGDDPPTNANLARLINVRVDACLGHGFVFRGADSNACTIFACDASSNAGDGFRDASFLGNSLVDCHAEANGDKSFALGVSTVTMGEYIDEVNSRSSAINCYVEGGQGTVYLGPRAKWYGPHPPGGFDESGTGSYKTDQNSNQETYNNEGVLLRLGRIGSPVAFEIASEDEGFNPWQMRYGDLASVVLAGTWSLQYKGVASIIAFFDDSFGNGGDLDQEQRQLYFPSSFSSHQRLKNQTSTRNLNTFDTGKVFSNRGAGAEVTLNLPLGSQVADGWWIDCEVVASQYLRVARQGSDTIRWLASTSTFVRSNAPGDTWRVRKSGTTEWTVCLVTAGGLLLGA